MIDRCRAATVSYLFWLCLVPLAASAGIFDLTEVHVAPSPVQGCSIQLAGVEKVVDYDVSPGGPEVAALVRLKGGVHQLILWRIGANETAVGWSAPADFVPRAIAWHPQASCIFVAGAQKAEYQIVRLDKSANGWKARSIFRSPNEIRRLVMGPSPFVVWTDEPGRGHEKEVIAHRVFFGMKNPDRTYRTVSITEEGEKFYQVIGPASTITHMKVEAETPSLLVAASALPVAFHPAAHQLIWEDNGHNFHFATYTYQNWEKIAKPLLEGMLKGGSVTPTPNGLGLLNWQPSSPGPSLLMLTTKREERQAADMQFVATPSSVPDGRGVVGLTRSGDGYTLNYVPITVPLADVVNAWMFCESTQDLRLLDKHGGLFRALENDQLYSLYESEMHYCGGYAPFLPTRPYLVTTDIFWELFAAAYEGLFIVKEREQAIPAFWDFVSAAQEYYEKSTGQPHWRPVFKALADLRSKDSRNPETARIRAARERQYSETLSIEVDYAELKPRGHYTSSPMMQDYFKAFRYLTSVYSDEPNDKKTAIMSELKTLPSEVKNAALTWIACYSGFIAPSRSPLVWKDGVPGPPPYARHPNPVPVLFPLAWGFDNEVLLSTVYHQDWPPAEQVTGPGGHRLLPSGLDVAAALGSLFADSLLQHEYEKFPALRQVIKNLKKLYDSKGRTSSETQDLYDRWISALAVQWADDVQPPDRGRDEKIWRAKRLQTGLASWATLRHATVLVNERTVAECGEHGFEEIVLRAPRGYVEPDPATFGAIAGLFETAVQHVTEEVLKKPDTMDDTSDGSKSLRQGVIRRFKETAEKARLFQSMAEKQLRGESLTSKEYWEILFVGRVAEHHFLIFKSLANKDYALSTPDPIAKIADVAGGGITPFLMAAVGKPVEWDHIVPFFGRHQIVKGPVYSYYEFHSDRLLNDQDWRGMAASQARPAWIRPFFADKNLSCPAHTQY